MRCFGSYFSLIWTHSLNTNTGILPSTILWIHCVHWGINPPPPPTHPLNLQAVQAPLFKQSPLYIGLSWIPSKNRIFSEHTSYQNFSSLTLSHLLKVTKIIFKISQFKFLVMADKNIFVYELSYFSLFFM